MARTSLGILERACRDRDFESWQRLMKIYGPFLRDWLLGQGVRPADADEIAQDVLIEAAKRIGTFRRDGREAFRAWLRRLLLNRVQRFVRTRSTAGNGDGAFPAELLRLGDSDGDLSRLWDDEHDAHVTRALAELVRERVPEPTWQAFRLTVLDGESVDAAAAHLGMSPNAVCAARSRFLHDLRREGRGLLDLP
ncbi:MAG TPA: sigma-70 family RNA polymerase sigma factor [Planctomycetaceae bacterium]